MPRADGVATAIHAAVAAIYFADSSDYSLALWDVVRALDPEVAELMENDEGVAYWVTSSEEPDDDVDDQTVAKVRAFRAARPALTPPAGKVASSLAVALVKLVRAARHEERQRQRGSDDAYYKAGDELDVARAAVEEIFAAQAREAEGIAFMCPGDGPLPARVAAAIHEVQERAGRAEREAEGLREALRHARLLLDDQRAAIDNSDREIARLRAKLIEWEEREAACCPEDVGFPEYVAALRERCERLEGEMESARRAMEKNATRLDRVSTYAIKHGPDVSVTKALAGICEDLTVHAIRLANVSARAAETGGEEHE